MAPSREAVAGEIEQFVCTEFLINQQDPMFTRNADLFDLGFVDSVGFVELLMFVETRYEIELDAEHLFAQNISSINGFGEIVSSLLASVKAGAPEGPGPSKVAAPRQVAAVHDDLGV